MVTRGGGDAVVTLWFHLAALACEQTSISSKVYRIWRESPPAARLRSCSTPMRGKMSDAVAHRGETSAAEIRRDRELGPPDRELGASGPSSAQMRWTSALEAT